MAISTKKIIQTLFLLTTLLGLGFQAQAEIANCTPITSVPTRITSAGVYCLTANLNYTANTGTAISVAANFVTIDLNGFLLSGTGNHFVKSNGISSTDRKNLIVRNGTIRGFYRGMFLRDTSTADDIYGNHLIEDMQLEANTRIGISIEGSGNLVRHNRITNTGGSTVDNFVIGIESWGPKAQILNNTIVGSFSDGFVVNIYAFRASSSIFQNNRIMMDASSTGSNYGIYMENSSPPTARVLIQGNFISVSTGLVGLRGYNATTAICRDNTIFNFTTPIDTCADGGGNVTL